MRIKGKPFAVAVIILLFAGIFLSKEALLKLYLSHYLRSRLGGQCSIERLSLYHNSIVVSGVRLRHEYFRFDIGRIKVDFVFSEFIKPRLVRIAASGADINIKSFAQTQDTFKKFLGESGSVNNKEQPRYSLVLEGISLAFKEKDLYLNTAFSFSGVIANQAPLLEVKQLKVDGFKLYSGDVSCAFRLEPAGDNRYRLYIDSVKRKDQEIKDVILLLEAAEDSVVIKESPFAFLGPTASVQGRFEFVGFEHFCVKAFLRTADFTRVAQFFGQEKNIIFNGAFNGEIGLCWEKGGFSDVNAFFASSQDGAVHISKEVSFDFLKKYLDEDSRKALVDSFNNYSYNNGTLTVFKKANTISFHFDFNSRERGRRDVLINFHMNVNQ